MLFWIVEFVDTELDSGQTNRCLVEACRIHPSGCVQSGYIVRSFNFGRTAPGMASGAGRHRCDNAWHGVFKRPDGVLWFGLLLKPVFFRGPQLIRRPRDLPD